MRFGFDGAIVTARRPYGLFGNPRCEPGVISIQVWPPSPERKRPLPEGLSGPSPPERKVHPFRRKSHMPTYRIFGLVGSIAMLEAPVEAFVPFRIRSQFLPPS